MKLFGRKKQSENVVAHADSKPESIIAATSSEERKEPLLNMVEVIESAPCKVEDTKPNLNDPEEGDSSRYHESKGEAMDPASLEHDEETEIETKIPNKNFKAYCGGCLAGISALPPTIKYTLAVVVAAGLVIMGFVAASGNSIPITRDLNVAFVGNSYIYVNDLPRMMEVMSDGHIFQDSCLHAQGSILNLLRTGNGMYNRWETETAMMDEQDEDGDALYDYGACSVPQLLMGHDEMISYENQGGAFYNDGNNPCFQSEAYYNYRASLSYSEPWDFVVMVDQSKRMCFEDAQHEAIMAFNYTYVPVLKNIKAKPIIVQPHAFWSENANMTGLEDIPTFTSLIMDGAKVYKNFLDKRLSSRQASKIAPVGDAFLEVWKDDGDMYVKLFLDDGVHPSGYGSILYGLVIYATIYGNMPNKDAVVVDDAQSVLFAHSRKLQAYNESQFPSEEETQYLYEIAQKVTNVRDTAMSWFATKESSSDSSSSAVVNDGNTNYTTYDEDGN